MVRSNYQQRGWTNATHGHLRKVVEREVACRKCGGAFQQRSRGRILSTKYCSPKCLREAQQARALARFERHPRTCPHCSGSFVPKWQGRSWQKFCGNRCRALYEQARRWVDVACAQCGRGVLKIAAQVKRSDNSFCSNDCRRLFHRGENHPQFRGTPAPFGYDWKRRAAEARERDAHTCRRCRRAWIESERLFPVDHIYPRRYFHDPALADNPVNLATLCHGCHGEKTTVAEAAWLRGDVLAFEAYKAAVLTVSQANALAALVAISLEMNA